MQIAANTAFMSQFGTTICLAVSLKAMWNLMHVMQVIAYLRLLVQWTANVDAMLKAVDNAITLDNVVDYFYSLVLTRVGLMTDPNLSDEEKEL